LRVGLILIPGLYLANSPFAPVRVYPHPLYIAAGGGYNPLLLCDTPYFYIAKGGYKEVH